MKSVNNITKNATLKKYQNQWVAFDENKNIIASSKSYLILHKQIKKEKRDKVEVTFIHPSNLYLAPSNGRL